MKMGQRIREYRLKRGLTQEELGKKIGVGKAAIQKYESGSVENIKRSSILTMSKVLEVAPSYLLGFDDPPTSPQSCGRYRAYPVYNKLDTGYNLLPKENIVGYEPADDSHDSGNYFFLTVSEDSMAPQLNINDIVLVEKSTFLDSGDIGVFLIDGENWMIKQIYYNGENIELHSFNPYYPTKKFTGKDALKVRVIGKVLQSRRNWTKQS